MTQKSPSSISQDHRKLTKVKINLRDATTEIIQAAKQGYLEIEDEEGNCRELDIYDEETIMVK